MRALALLPMLFVAACGGDAPDNKAEATAELSPGQWELTSQVTRFVKSDQGNPRINTPVGTRATQSICFAASRRLPTEIFSGEGFTCSYGNYYVRNGRASVTLTCRREGLSGDDPMTVAGHFGADSIQLHRSLRTILTTDGDVSIDADVTGRRTGACTPALAPATPPAGSASQTRQ